MIEQNQIIISIFKKISFVTILVFSIWWLFFSLPEQLFNTPTATVLYDNEGSLLSGHIASDGQWRFPSTGIQSERFKKALITFEDKHFYKHPGIDPSAIARAIKQNWKAKKIKSGASTLSMQVIRMSRRGKSRTISEKLYEMILALRLELKYSKEEILNLWASNAPFGGNVVGIDAASWRYFGRPSNNLSWSEAATLAVLPNAPSIIHPGKNRSLLEEKRNRLLKKLWEENIIDELEYELGKIETLPQMPIPIPRKASHLLDKAMKNGMKGKQIFSSINNNYQSQLQEIINRQYQRLNENEIHNAAAIILDVKSNKILAYIGNTPTKKKHGSDVDIIQAARSSGSILKPFLYASMIQAGTLQPKQLVADIPTRIAGYMPKNFHDKYDGAVPADEALSRSLNIPAVRMLTDFGVGPFHHQLNKLPFKTIKKPADHYGLSLILGGAEVSLWDLSTAYGGMARTLNQYYPRNGDYLQSDWNAASYLTKAEEKKNKEIQPILDAASIYLTFEAMTSVKRPNTESGWMNYGSSRKVAWKTGTSYGFRDAWAVGVTPEYVIAVWVGNADGEGRPGLVGVEAAAPILFEAFRMLPSSTWFERPFDELRKREVCTKSGYRASKYCNETDSMWIHKNGMRGKQCPFHKQVFVDATENYQVNADCYNRQLIKRKNYFLLTPTMAFYYKKNNADYEEIPPYLEKCAKAGNQQSQALIQIVYPENEARLKIPKVIDGTKSRAVFEIAHQSDQATVYWYLDQEYIGKTTEDHQLEINPKVGRHLLTVLDDNGEEKKRWFEIY